MDIENCKLCFNNNNNITTNHENCKYDFFDILKNMFKTEIDDIKKKLNDQIETCKQLQEHNEILSNENIILKSKIKILEDDRLHEIKAYELAPDTPTQNTSLNRAMMEDTSNDESYKENVFDKNQSVGEFSSPDEKKSKYLDIPRRKKIIFGATGSNSNGEAMLETKWISKKSLNKSNIGFSFIQPMHKITNGADASDNQAQAKVKPTLSKISLNKTKKLKQTRIQFNKSTDDFNNTRLNNQELNDETYCDDVIMPTPNNIPFVRTIRSGNFTSASISPESKIFDFEPKSKEENNKRTKLSLENDMLTPPINTNDSVEFLPVDEEIIFVSDSTTANNFESENSSDSYDLLEKYSEFCKVDIKDDQDVKKLNPSELRNIINEYQVTSPVRKKSEKAKRPGFDCQDCERYYQMIGVSMSDTELQNRMNNCSKHRKNQRLHNTPEGFWNPVFTPTQN